MSEGTASPLCPPQFASVTSATLVPESPGYSTMGDTLGKRLTLAFAAALLLLGSIVVLTYRSTERLHESNLLRQSAALKALELERLHTSVADAETGQRGYLLTGNDRDLEPYHAAVELIPGHRDRLDSLGVRGPMRDRLDSLVDRQMAEIEARIGQYRLEGAELAIAALRNGDGNARMDSIRASLAHLKGIQDAALSSSLQEERDQARTVLLAIAALALSGLVVLGGLFATVSRHAAERQAALQQVSLARAHLEERVRERTAALELELAQRLRAEQGRHASETQYRILVEQIEDHAIFSMAPDGTATTWNEGVARVLGFGEAEFIGSPAERIFIPEDVEAGVPRRELDEAARHGVAGNDRWMQRRDGSRFFANGSTTALRNEHGQLIGFSKVMRDQTTARQTEEALRASETRYRLVALASRETIWDWDLTTGGLDWNEAIEMIFGYPAAAAGRDIAWWENRIHPEERQRVIDSRRTAIDRGERFWSADYRFQRSDGHYATVTDRGVIARDDQGRPYRMLGTIADVTERRRTDEKLSQAQRMEAVGRLAGGIAHDLNNMLTAIVGYSTFLEQAIDPDDARRGDVAEIIKAADRSAALTRSLLAFARREIVHPQPVDLNRIVLEIGRMLRPAMGESIQVELALEPITGTVVADRSRLEQVILNIALNARDAMPAGGRLAIATRSVLLTEGDAARHPGTEVAPGRYVKLTISDTGTGMDAETLSRVFEPFFTTKDVGEGTGLGLSGVYGTVKQAGGFVWAYSEPGHGSSFTVYLPENPASEADDQAADGGEPARGGSETILLVEDEAMVRALAQRILVAEGYRVLSAGSGEEAVVTAQRAGFPIDLLITDIVMPGMGGRDLARAIIRQDPEVRVLFTSGFTDDEVVRRGLMDQGQPFMEKPWSSERLLSRVRELLDQKLDRTGWARASVRLSPEDSGASRRG